MSEVFGAVLGALALVGIPLFSWYSRRATREGRLLLRIERLGGAYALMPASDEKEAFKIHITRAAADLNAWLDLDNTRRRMQIRVISWATYLLAAIAVLLLAGWLKDQPALQFCTGLAIGTVIAGLNQLTTFLFERRARKTAERDVLERANKSEAIRVALFKAGEPLTVVRAEN